MVDINQLLANTWQPSPRWYFVVTYFLLCLCSFSIKTIQNIPLQPGISRSIFAFMGTKTLKLWLWAITAMQRTQVARKEMQKKNISIPFPFSFYHFSVFCFFLHRGTNWDLSYTLVMSVPRMQSLQWIPISLC